MKAALRLTAVFAVLLALIALPGCGGKHHRAASLPSAGGAPTTHEQTPVSLDDTLAQLDALARPDGVDAKLWADLTSALRTALTANSRDGKLTSKPPTGEANRVTDLAYMASSAGTGYFNLQWSYKNAGDYNLDGKVDIRDITPLALHFGQAADETNNWVDGNGDCAIGVADIQPLAANFGSDIERFIVEHATLTGEFEYLSEKSMFELLYYDTLPGKVTDGRANDESREAHDDYWRYRVVPIDSEGNEGIPSEELLIGTSAEIGPEGGTLESEDGKIKLVVPPGAIAEMTDLHMRTYERDYTMPFADETTCYISPQTKELNLPTELTIHSDLTQALSPENELSVCTFSGATNSPTWLNDYGYTSLSIPSSRNLIDGSVVGYLDRLGYFTVAKMPGNASCVSDAPDFSAFMGRYAFATEEGQLTAYNINEPLLPKFISGTNITGTYSMSPRSLNTFGEYALRESGGWLTSYKLTDPLNILELGSVWVGDSITDMEIADGFAYLTRLNEGLVIVDLTNPATPVVRSRISTPIQVSHIALKGDKAYLAVAGNICVVDVSDPSNPGVLSVVPVGGYIKELIIDGYYAYCCSRNEGLLVVDITIPDEPQVVGSFPAQFELNLDYEIAVLGSTLYLPGNGLGLLAIDISDPTQPTLQKTISTPGDAHVIRIYGTTAFVNCAGGSGCLLIIQLDEPQIAEPTSWVSIEGTINHLELKGDYIYIAAGTKGLQLLDVSNPKSPSLASSIMLPEEARLVSSNGDYAAVWARGLYIIDVRDKSNPALVGSLDCGLGAEKMFLNDNRLFAVGYWLEQGFQSQGLFVFDISEPSLPALIWSGIPEERFTDTSLFIKDSVVYTDGITIYDFTDISNPTTLCNLDFPAQALDLFVLGHYACIAGYSDLQIADVSDMSKPVLVGLLRLDEGGNHIQAAGTRVFVQNYPSMKIIDVSIPSQPILLGEVGNSQWESEFVTSGDYLYVSTAGGILAKDISTI